MKDIRITMSFGREPGRLRRRRLLQALSTLPLREPLLAAGAAGLAWPSTGLPATPACGAGSAATPRQTEGPYFTRDSPERATLLEPGIAGQRLVLSGTVLSLDCRPLAGALLDFWQADADGAYDNQGYRLRGHQFTDADGRYRLETVVPGLYPGRTRHIHVKVQSKGGPVLTTQLYFPDVPEGATPRRRLRPASISWSVPPEPRHPWPTCARRTPRWPPARRGSAHRRAAWHRPAARPRQATPTAARRRLREGRAARSPAA